MKLLHIITQAVLAILIWTAPAYAGPAFVAAAGALAKKILINMVVGAIVGKVFGKKKGLGSRAAREASVLVNKQSNNDYIPIVYGQRRIGGTRAYVATTKGDSSLSDNHTGKNNLLMVIALCEGRMGNIKQVYFDDTVVWDADESGTTSGSNADGYTLDNFEDTKFQNYISAQYFIGHPNQNKSSLIKDAANEPDDEKWGDEHRLRGIAYLALKLVFNADAFEGGVPTVTVVLDGKNLRDVDNTSNIVSGANQNPADVMYNYLTTAKGLDRDSSGNFVAGQDIDLASFQRAKAYCASRYEINGLLDTEDSIIDNVEKIALACNGQLIYHNGKYKFKIKGDVTQSEIDNARVFNTTNILGDVSVTLTDIKNRLNKVTVNYPNDSAEVKFNDDVVVRESTTYKGYDQGKTLEAQLDLPLVTDTTLAENMGDFFLDDSRNNMSIVFDAAHTEFGVEPGEVIKVTLDDYGFSNKLFRVLQTELTPENTINIIAQEYNQSIHI